MPRSFVVDPGITSGFSIGVVTEDCFYVTSQEGVLSHGQLYDRIEKLDPHHLVSESFEFRGRARDNVELFSRELIGVMRLAAEQHLVGKFHLQTAAEGKGNFTDSKLKSMGLYVKGKVHGRDAIRHQLQWWIFNAGFQYNKGQEIVLVEESYLYDEKLIE